MTDGQQETMDRLNIEQIGETDDGLILAQSSEDGRVFLVAENGMAWMAEWTACY